MTNEKIITNIEKYIDTLSKDEKSCYRQALANAEEQHRTVKDCYGRYSEPVFELVEIVQELKKEMKGKAIKAMKVLQKIKGFFYGVIALTIPSIILMLPFVIWVLMNR